MTQPADLNAMRDLVLKTATPAALATNYSGGEWLPFRHLLYLDELICDCIAGRRPERVIVIDAPPRHGKTEFVSHWLPTWYLGKYPDRRVMVTGYGKSFAGRSGRMVRRSFRRIVTPLFGHRIDPERRATHEFEIDHYGGGMVATGIGGDITGRGAHLLVIDDPIKNSEEALSPTTRESIWNWFLSTARPRLEPNGVVVVMATRWHREDLSGRLLHQSAAEDGMPVAHVHLPAIAEDDDQIGRVPGEALCPQRYDREALDQINAGMTSYWWQALYQGRPTRAEQAAWPNAYFGPHLWPAAWPDRFEWSVIAVDPSKGRDAKRSDFTGIVFAGLTGGKVYVDAIVERMPASTIVGRTLEMAIRMQPDAIGFEAVQFQELLVHEFRRQCAERGLPPLDVHEIPATVNKQLRIERLGPYLAEKILRFRDTPGCRRVVEQLEEFPLGEHDDGPDALEMAVRLMREVAMLASQYDEDERISA